MRAVVQRVSRAKVAVDGETVGAIGPGLLVLLGVGAGDTRADADYLAEKTIGLRIFEDGGAGGVRRLMGRLRRKWRGNCMSISWRNCGPPGCAVRRDDFRRRCRWNW